MQRCLVSGGAGFLGSHLCRRLLADGHEVICLDNFFTSQKSNVAEFLDNSRFELVRHDVTEPFHCEVDWIFNLACPASPVHYQYNPIKTVKTSFMGAINMLGLAKRLNARILQASTSEVRLPRAAKSLPDTTVALYIPLVPLFLDPNVLPPFYTTPLNSTTCNDTNPCC